MRGGGVEARLRQGWGPQPFGPLPLCSRPRWRLRVSTGAPLNTCTPGTKLANSAAARAIKLTHFILRLFF